MTPPKSFYITTAIDYANGLPHLGHALEKIGADVVARYHRSLGEAVRFVIGMDEHGQNVLQSAEKEDVSPQLWVDRIAGHFRTAWERLSISNDDFIRTTEERHHRAVTEMIRRIETNGDLYRDSYAGYYCVRCEAYKTEDELVPAPEGEGEEDELRCPLHLSRRIEWMEEQNWFFRLSSYQAALLELLDERPSFVEPEIRRNEVRKVIEGGLDDISVSRRHLPWGVPWPGEPEQTVYVWLDALTNYLSATGFPGDGFQRYWPADVHVIGKDISRFHCIYWPAFLMSAGLELPRQVWIHGFVTYGGRRLSKSEGVSYELDEAVSQHGPEPLRYYLLREVPWDGDGDITRERFDERYTTELANDIGNLASRTLAMVEKYRNARLPAGDGTPLHQAVPATLDRYREEMDAGRLHRGIAEVLSLVSRANVFVEEQAPWKLVKEDELAEELDRTLHGLAFALAATAAMLHPFLPTRMEELAARLGLDEVPTLGALRDLELEGVAVHRGSPLFPRDDLAGS